MSSERMEALEIKMAFLEKTVLDLDEVVRALADSIADLRREVNEIRDERAEHDNDMAANKPPHY